MAAFDYRQAEEIRDALARHAVRYLFIGKAGAILLDLPRLRSFREYWKRSHPGP
jgi:hypothetical protein